LAQTRRQLAIIRQFPENGLKLLLENAANFCDLLALADSPEGNLIDFDKLTQERTTFVSRDYRHVEAEAADCVALAVRLRKRLRPDRDGRAHLHS
jgi:hypothetical protein